MPSDADLIADLARRSTPGGGAATTALPPASPRQRYFAATRTATYGFLAALPLLVLYEVGIVLANGGQLQAVRVGADLWVKRLVGFVGGTGGLAIGLVVLIIGAVIFWAERKQRPPLRARYFGLIVAESLLYAVVLAFVVGGIVGLLFGVWATPAMLAQPMARLSLPLQLALSIGAGLYEELVFRVLLVGGLFLAVRRLIPKRTHAYLVAALIGAFVFSLVHYLGPLGDPFQFGSFTFRFLFGLALNAVFLVRGFAVAAWTHALYDVLVVTGSFS
ncbi:MAG: CPBP family intramembrane metalloprotease [Rhodothermaceae bacterium]|nr:CPBP family intramembrane metalloprotease [Rhodothermaceae bacterium]